MPAKALCMIYGANGFTGRLVARVARDHGLPLLLAGRSAPKIEPLAAGHGVTGRVFGLDEAEPARAALEDVLVVANCAGPFSATSGPMIDACLATGTHYLDITGEIDVFLAARERHEAARAAGVALCPGVGFDVVPTDCLAAVLAEALPDATSLALGFDVAGVPSAGTARTIVEGLGRGGRVRENGAIVPVPFGHRRRLIDYGRGAVESVTLPLGDVATAYFSTGIANIETYAPAPAAARIAIGALNILRPLLATPPVQTLLGRLAQGAKGPSETELSQGRAYIWGEVRNAAGETRSARTSTPNGYRFTAASTVMALAHVLAERPAGGYYTPTQLMGPRCVERVEGVEPIRLQ